MLQLVDLDDRRAHQCAIDRSQALESRTRSGSAWIGPWRRFRRRRVLPELRRQFRIAGLEQADERALLEGAADGLHFRELVAAAEDVDKRRGLAHEAPEHP